MAAQRIPKSGAKPACRGRTSLPADGLHYQQMLRVLKQFRVVIANIKEHYRDVEDVTGVSGAQLWALYAIAMSPGITVGELARELALHQSTVSNLLDKMIEQGYIERRRISSDQRVVTIMLTAAGQRIVKSAPQPSIGLLQQALLTMPEARLDSLHDDLADLIRNIGLKKKNGASTPLSISLGGRKTSASEKSD